MANGFGVNSGSVPPKGATNSAAGLELAMMATKPRSAAIFASAARQPM